MSKATIITTILVSLVLSSCTLSKAMYLGDDSYRTGLQSIEVSSTTEDINGIFPEAVYIKTRTQSFNAYHYYMLKDGLIWYKSIDGEQEPVNWTLFTKTGLPHDPWKITFNKPKKIVAISADADELVALSDEGGFYRYGFDLTIAHKSGVWLDRQGWPSQEQLFFDRRTGSNRSWALGKRNAHVLYYEDPFGNQHHNGTMEIVTTYVLLEDGQEICYADTGLPPDFSRNYLGPERGTFKAVSLSASASTMFVINEAGEMYTRLADFDTVGCDPMLFKYTYTPYKSDLPGTNYFSNLNEWGLPAEEWRPQPSIPLTGKAVISRHITILQNGQGNEARELRVAGLNESGKTGYWTKAIFDDIWNFKPVPLYFSDDAMLPPQKSMASRVERGPSLDKSYSGYSWNGDKKEQEWNYTIPNFNILEGACDFHITWRDETCILKLYPLEMWTYLKRNYLPGRTGSPKMFLVTLEIPENAFDGLSAEFTARLTQKYAKNNRKLLQYIIAASDTYIFMRETGNTHTVLFLTDGKLSNHYAEFLQLHLVENFEEIQRYYWPDLAAGNQTVISYQELDQKIELNKTFRDALKYQIRTLKWSQLTAFRFNAGYIPLHYLITPLRFIDVPKIRTITSFSDKIILENSSYIYTISNIRIWVYEKIIEMLEVRLLYYKELKKECSETASNSTDMAESASSFRYSDNTADYWDIAGLPLVISGTFFNSDTRPRLTRPAVLSFIRTETEPDLFGWPFSMGKSVDSAMSDHSFSIFIDPLKSLRTIYSRNGKNPKEKRVQLDCTLYINPRTNSPVEQDIIDTILKPFIKENAQSIKARISFDGENFEIRQYPSGNGKSLIFWGKAVF
ncbi:MAG: hypothetical protein LBK43_10515 [Treponema sp.]|nr:hypothetical protein [Treponema sp.]